MAWTLSGARGSLKPDRWLEGVGSEALVQTVGADRSVPRSLFFGLPHEPSPSIVPAQKASVEYQPRTALLYVRDTNGVEYRVQHVWHFRPAGCLFHQSGAAWAVPLSP